jgi:LPXTG-motif cell wall-anchored protein
MTFLPKTADARQELLTILIAIPVSLLGTGFFFYLLDGAARVVA